MLFSFQHFLRTLILGAFCVFFIKLHVTGEIAKYINPKYDLMSQIAAGIFVVLFFVQLARVWQSSKHDHHHEHCDAHCDHNHGYSDSFLKKAVSYSIIIFPLLTGFMLSPATLDASIAANKGSVLGQAALNQGNSDGQSNDLNNEKEDSLESPEVEPSERNLDEDPNTSEETYDEESNVDEFGDLQSEEHDEVIENDNYLTMETYHEKMDRLKSVETINMESDIFVSYYEEISMNAKEFAGKDIKLKGFVYKEDGFSENQLVISRFVIMHCVADASIIGFLSEYKDAHKFEEDTWVEIEGTIDVTNYNDMELPIVKINKLTEIDEPSDPYIYPTQINVTD